MQALMGRMAQHAVNKGVISEENLIYSLYETPKLQETKPQTYQTGNKQSGNVLFLILIAVALFAALSYAVTQSSRGGGKIGSENVQMKIVEVIQQASLITQTIKRKYLMGYNGQIQLSDDPENLSGTVFNPNRTQSTGKTIGFFTPEISGLTYLIPPIEIRDTASSGWGIVYNSSLVVGGNDMGTSAGDEFLIMTRLTEEACIEINKGLHGEKRIGTYSVSSGSGSATRALVYHKTYLPVSPGNASNSTYIEFLPGCNGSTQYNRFYYELIKAN
jgi:hypothetical protein